MKQKVLIVSGHDTLRKEIFDSLKKRNVSADESIALVLDRGLNGVVRGYLPDNSLHSFDLRDYGVVIIDPDSLSDNSTPGANIAETFSRANKLVVWIGASEIHPNGVVVVSVFNLSNFLNCSPELNLFRAKVEA
jgi:hypothetical protein